MQAWEVVHCDHSTVSYDLQTFHLSGPTEVIRQDYSTAMNDLEKFHSSIPVGSVSRDSHGLFPTDIQHRTDVVTDSASCTKISYTTDFMRQLKQTMNSVTLSQDGKDRLEALGILRRFHCGRRGGIRINKQASSLYTGIGDVTEKSDQCAGQPIPVVITNRSGCLAWNKSPAGRSKLQTSGRIIQIPRDIFSDANNSSSDGSDPNGRSLFGHRILFINATSLAKAEALSRLHADMISYDVEICLVAETWLKQNKHPDSMFNVDGSD